MRINVEDEDLASNKLKMAAQLIAFNEMRINHEHLALGLLVSLWHGAINEKKIEITDKDISRYTHTYNKKECESVIKILSESGYISETEDGMYSIVGKEKDYEAKKFYEEKARIMRDVRNQKMLKSMEKLKKDQQQTNVDESLTVSLTQMITESITESITVNSNHKISSAKQCKAVQSNTNKKQIHKTNTTQISSSLESVIKKPTETLKEKYFELYEKKYGKKPIIWGAAENTNAKQLLTSIPVNDGIQMLEYFFAWQNPKIIAGGHSFSKGYASFIFTLSELQADILKPERRIDALKLQRNDKLTYEQKLELQNQEIIKSSMEKNNYEF